MGKKFTEEIEHEDEGKIKVVDEPTQKEMHKQLEKESDVYDSERAID